MSAPVDVLAAMDHNLKDRAERAARYGKKADQEAGRRGSRNPTSDRKADLERHLLERLSSARAAVAELIAAAERLIDSANPELSGWAETVNALARVRGAA